MFYVLLLLIGLAQGADPEAPKAIVTNSAITLEDGDVIPLQRAAASEVACFPGTAFKAFQGKHSFLQFDLKSGKDLVFVVTPPPGVDINIYALQKWHDSEKRPPNVSRAFRCEASYSEKGAETLRMRGYKTSMPILLGVASADPEATGKVTVEIREETGRQW